MTTIRISREHRGAPTAATGMIGAFGGVNPGDTFVEEIVIDDIDLKADDEGYTLTLAALSAAFSNTFLSESISHDTDTEEPLLTEEALATASCRAVADLKVGAVYRVSHGEGEDDSALYIWDGKKFRWPSVGSRVIATEHSPHSSVVLGWTLVAEETR